MAKTIFNTDSDFLGTITATSIANATGDVVTLDAFNVLKRRTYAEILTDIGAAPLVHTHVIADVTDFTDSSTDWNTAFSCGDHAGLYSLLAHTAFSWGDHAGLYSLLAHTHLLTAGATDVTATAAEVNLLDLAGLTAGWVLSADTATTASWKAPAGGGVTDHGALTGLADNDHPQYVLKAGDTMTGALSWTVAAGNLELNQNISAAAVDEKSWDSVFTTGGTLLHRVVNDANSLATTYMTVNRTGITVDSIDLNAGVISAASNINTTNGFVSARATAHAYTSLFGNSGTANNFLFGGSSTGSTTTLDTFIRIRSIADGDLTFQQNSLAHKIWHQGNDGAGSSLDADLLDGFEGSDYLRNNVGTAWTSTGNNNFSFRTTAADGGLSTSADTAALEVYSATGDDAYMQFHIAGQYAFNFGIDKNSNDLFVGGWSMGNATYKVWHQGNDGSGSGLDADTLRTFAPSTAATGNTVALRDSAGDLYAVDLRFDTLIEGGGNGNPLRINGTGLQGDNTALNYWTGRDSAGTALFYIGVPSTGNNDLIINNYSGNAYLRISDGGDVNGLQYYDGTGTGTVWHSRNDGSGSGLDADKFIGFGRTTSGNRWGRIAPVETSGVIEIGRYIDFHNTNADSSDNTFRIDNNANGNLGCNGTLTATNFILSSDKRLKTKVKTLERDPINLRWVEFDRIADGKHQIGLIAQEVEKTNPEFVITDKEGFKSVKYIDVLVAKMAEKDKQIERLEKRIDQIIISISN